MAAPLTLGANAGASFLLIDLSARDAAMAGSGSSSGGLGAMRHNPAGLAFNSEAALALSYQDSFGDWNHQWISGSWPQGRWTFGAEFFSSQIKPIPYYNSLGIQEGVIEVGQMGLGAALAYQISPRLDFGLNLKGFQGRIAEYKNQGWSTDLGAGFSIGKLGRLGVAVQNLGSQSAYLSQSDPLPLLMRAGYSARLGDQNHKTLVLRADGLFHFDAVAGQEFRFGGEFGFFNVARLRGGLRVQNGQLRPTAGAGFDLKNMDLSYAFVHSPVLGGSHLVTLEWRAGKGR